MAEKKLVAENGQPWSLSSLNGKSQKSTIQSTISSFFKPKTPNYAMAPGSPLPPPQTIGMGGLSGSAPKFKSRSPETDEEWVRMSPPKMDDPSTPSNLDGAVHDVVALDDIEDPVSPTLQIQREAANMTTGRDPKLLDTRASIIPIEPSHVTSIRRINFLLLCITYPPWFYQQLAPPTPYGAYSRAIMWTPKPGDPPLVIGSLITRRDPVTEFKRSGEKEGVKADDTALYIAALTLLSPYRGKGLAQAALESVICQIVRTPHYQEAGGIKSLYAHVWTQNTEGLDWYKKMGFEREGKPVEGYYSRLTPSTAWVLRRQIGVGEHLMPTVDAPSKSWNNELMRFVEANAPPPEEQEKELKQSTMLKRPGVGTARSFMSKGPENEWNDLPKEMVVPRERSGTPSVPRTPGTSAPPSGPPSAVPSRTPSVAPPGEGADGIGGFMATRPYTGEGGVAAAAAGARRKKRNRAYAPAAINGDLVNGSESREGSGM